MQSKTTKARAAERPSWWRRYFDRDHVGLADAPVPQLVNMILLDSDQKHATQIQGDTGEVAVRANGGCPVRFRIGDQCPVVMTMPSRLTGGVAFEIVSRARLDPSDYGRPQVGMIRLNLEDGRMLRFRVKVDPGPTGDRIEIDTLAPTDPEPTHEQARWPTRAHIALLYAWERRFGSARALWLAPRRAPFRRHTA